MVIGFAVLMSWGFGLDTLGIMPTGTVSMKANTACCFIALGLASLLLENEAPSLWRKYLGIGCASLVLIVGCLILIQYAFGLSLGIDELLFLDRGPTASIHPGRMAPNTAFNFVLLGLAAILLRCPPRAIVVAQSLTLLTLITTGVAFIGSLFHAQIFVVPRSFALMALHTMLAFIALGVAMLFSRAEAGIMKVVQTPSPGGFIARCLLTATIMFPLVLGYLTLAGQKQGFYDPAFATSLLVSLNIIALGVLI